MPRAPNKLYARAAHFSSPYRYGITLCFFGMTIAAWFCLIYRPVEAALGAYSAYNGTMRTECTHGMQCQRAARDLAKEIDQLRIMFDSDAAHIDGCVDWVSSVMSCAQKAGLSIKTYTSDAQVKKEWYCCTNAQFEFTGTYEHLLLFLSDLTTKHSYIGCKQWSIVRASAGNYSMVSTLYFFQPIQTT